MTAPLNFSAASAAMLSDGRLHLHHGPIDLVIEAWGEADAVRTAYTAARDAFAPVLGNLVAELPALKSADGQPVFGPVACRMAAAVGAFPEHFITPMAAVAGSVADHVLAAMTAAAPLARACVNNGGDIAVHLSPGETLTVALAAHDAESRPHRIGDLLLSDPTLGGVATSGRHGRSFSLGIADAVTVLAADAARADAAATLIANATDIDSPAIVRAPARSLDPDSDLGDLPVTVEVGPLTPVEIAAALAAALAEAEVYCEDRRIAAAAVTLGGRTAVAGQVHRVRPAA